MEDQTHLISCDKGILGGIPVLPGTRVPAKTLLDYIQKGSCLDDYLDDFPTVTHLQAHELLARLQSGALAVRLTFLPEGVVVTASCGETILDAALENGVGLEHECGGNCACTTCQLYVVTGGENLSIPEEVELDRLSTAEGLQANSRLGCQALLTGGDVTVHLIDSGADKAV